MQLLVLVQVNMTAAPLAAAEAELRAWAAFVAHERPSDLMAPTACCFHHSELLGNGVPIDAVVKPVPGWDGDRVTSSDTLGEFTFSLNPNSYFQVRTHLLCVLASALRCLASCGVVGRCLDRCRLLCVGGQAVAACVGASAALGSRRRMHLTLYVPCVYAGPQELQATKPDLAKALCTSTSGKQS